MNRREFIKTSGALVAPASVHSFGNLLNAAGTTTSDMESRFAWKDPEVMGLTKEIFQKCILQNVFPAKAPLKHTWIGPGGNYIGQWIWDTVFIVDLLSILPGKEQIIRDVFQNYWDFQARWNERMPDFAHDMVACMISPELHDQSRTG